MMDAEDIARLCGSLSLIERDGPVRKLDVNLNTAAIERMSLCLVGKILSRKTVNREAFIRVMGKEEEDQNRILSRDPWSFDDALIALEKPTGKGTMESLSFKTAVFWVQIHQIPLLCMTRDNRWFLGGMIGEVVDIDGGFLRDCVGKFMRVRVRIEIDKPLRRCLRVDILGDGVETVMILRYERLPNHCFRCDMVCHRINECGEKEQDVVEKEKGNENPLFGIWMGASGPPPPPPKRNNAWDCRGHRPQEENGRKRDIDGDRNGPLSQQISTTGTGKTTSGQDIKERGGDSGGFPEPSIRHILSKPKGLIDGTKMEFIFELGKESCIGLGSTQPSKERLVDSNLEGLRYEIGRKGGKNGSSPTQKGLTGDRGKEKMWASSKIGSELNGNRKPRKGSWLRKIKLNQIGGNSEEGLLSSRKRDGGERIDNREDDSGRKKIKTVVMMEDSKKEVDFDNNSTGIGSVALCDDLSPTVTKIKELEGNQGLSRPTESITLQKVSLEVDEAHLATKDTL
ncbi:hypothetical protein EZV62_015189 [Acer yangbiense]|uniref:DUF4283 domain-containing protein n=1 Tax=Acer yangbiense TaxID=1000413 RepID=A0A5C7HWB5_9ROSI|nr:hypothetical protein EZV62_015189 [Acer yangbiense]